MAIQREGYYYNGQVVRYLNQFMAVFQGLQVIVGKWNTEDERLISVPIHYANPDRVVASIIAGNTQNQPIRLPTMSAYMTDLKMAPERYHGVGGERRNTYVPVGGLVPDDMKVIHQRMPVPMNLLMDLYLFASNENQHLQMLEQIVPLFDPMLQIQTGDAPFDWTRQTIIKMTDVSMDRNFPMGQEQRIIQSKLSFEIQVWIDTPAEVRRDFVEKIYARIGMVGAGADMQDSYEIIAELDAQNIPYDLVATDENLPFN